MTFNIYSTITDKIIRQIEEIEGNPNWKKPWFNMGLSPINLNGKSYRGINQLLLSNSDYNSNTWATFKAWTDKDCYVKKGEKSRMVVFWKFFKGEEGQEDEGEIKHVMCRYYNVFNAEQVEGDYARTLEAKTIKRLNQHEKHADSEAIINDYLKAALLQVKQSDKASYSTSIIGERINMPTLGQFSTPEHYYSTFFHEIGHSTGAENRLKRDLTGRFGSEAYAAEELIAELTAAMLCGHVGINQEPLSDHAHYLKSWLKVLRSDNRAIFTAASQAQKACDYVIEQAASVKNHEKIAV
jgi:antirestriction protein ArdC